ncbi:MAG TPA: FtsX-like permease family protein, partial [Longimicrobium sp.]|nr:FtsX-like permease family protein [Longimicrobium sp.]
MRALRTLSRLAWRESRFARRRLLLFLGSITLGVAALVATQSFADNLSAGVRNQARAMLGADVSLVSTKRYGRGTEALLDSLRRARVPVARVSSFYSMGLVERSGGARLVQVRAVDPGYPFYGEIETGPAGRWAGLQAGRAALVDPAVLTSLDARIGDEIRIGGARLRIIGTLEKVPGSVGVGALFAPRVYMPARYLGETGLIRFGSRVEYEAYVRLPARGAAEKLVAGHRPTFRAERIRASTASEQQADLDLALRRLGSFLGLVGTFALLLGGMGVASAMSAYMAQKRETVATLRCLGATAPQVITVYLLQAGAMGLIGAVLGTLIGVSVQWVLPRLLADLLPVEIDIALSLPAIATGIGIGVWIAVAFALLPLIATRRISPLEAVRRRVEGDGVRRRRLDPWVLGGWGMLAASIIALIMVQAKELVPGLGFAAGVAATLGVLWVAAWLLARLARRAPRGLSYPARQGIANLHRPGNQTRVVVMALGFGVYLLAVVFLVQNFLLAPLRIDTGSRGNLLLFDIQQAQQAGVRSLLRETGVPVVQQAPIVPMRIHELRGRKVRWSTRDLPARPAADTADGGGDDRPQGRRADGRRADGQRSGPEDWAVRREYRSTYRDALIGSEKLREGRMWKPGEGAPPGGVGQVSIDIAVAGDLGVQLGDTIVWDVQGVRMPTAITSIREVDWQRMEPNFFAVFPSQALAQAPQTWVMLARAPNEDARGRVQRDVVRRFSNVVVLDLTAVQEALDDVFGQVSAVIRFLAGFSVATGFIVLLGAVLTSRLQRIRESVLLRTLGATRRQVGAILLTEYLSMGLLASIAGIGLAAGAGWAL